MKHFIKNWHLLIAAVLLVGTAMAVTSCGDDEPSDMTIDYYLDVEEVFLINGSTGHTDRYDSPITRMYDTIRKAYPTPDKNGNDDVVVLACDKEYETYVGMYTGLEAHFTCVFHLVRATKRGSIVVKNEELKTYVYDINPVIPPEEDEGDDEE